MTVLRRVLAKRRQHDAVGQLSAADLKRLEKLWNVAGLLAFGDNGSTCWWVLLWGEVGNLVLMSASCCRLSIEATYSRCRSVDIVRLLFELLVDVVV